MKIYIEGGQGIAAAATASMSSGAPVVIRTADSEYDFIVTSVRYASAHRNGEVTLTQQGGPRQLTTTEEA